LWRKLKEIEAAASADERPAPSETVWRHDARQQAAGPRRRS
jgi:hypothetical protein